MKEKVLFEKELVKEKGSAGETREMRWSRRESKGSNHRSNKALRAHYLIHGGYQSYALTSSRVPGTPCVPCFI